MFTTKSPFEIINSILTPQIIYERYINNLKYDVKIKSPLRSDDDTPSFIIYSNTLKFVDFGGARGSCYDFVMHLFNCTFINALRKLDTDFELGVFNYNVNIELITNSEHTSKIHTFDSQKLNIRIKKRKWNQLDKEFWTSFNISYKTLKLYDVYPISHYWIEKNNQLLPFVTDKLAYCYVIGSRVKIYQPLRHKLNWKFLGNTSRNSIQGYCQIKEDYNLIIASSLKDVMVIHECGFNAIAPSSESTIIGEWLVDSLKTNHKLHLFYDWDKAGISLMLNHSEIYKCNYYYPKGYQELLDNNIKDISDYSREYGIVATKNFIQNILNF